MQLTVVLLPPPLNNYLQLCTYMVCKRKNRPIPTPIGLCFFLNLVYVNTYIVDPIEFEDF